VSKRAPYSFVPINNIVWLLIVWINQLNCYLLFSMRERAKISIFTHERIFSKCLTKFTFVPTWVIELLNFIMRFLTIAIGFRTRDMIVRIKIRSPFIFIIMIEKTYFSLVLVLIILIIPFLVHCFVLKS